jgi:hypothetical protein
MWLATLFHYPLVIARQIVLDALYFPLWWYSRGLYICLRALLNFCDQWWRALAVALWLKYLFVPMYGQRDFFGRLISFMMRVLQIVFRMMLFVMIAGLASFAMLVWLILPVLIIWMIIYQINGLYGR